MKEGAKKKKFLVIQTASIGDVILSTALIEKLHQTYPHGLIDCLVKKGTNSLFNGHPFLRKVLVWDKQNHKYRNFIQLLAVIQNEKYDYVINVQRFASTGLLTVLSGARHTMGFKKNPLSLFFGKRVQHSISQHADNIHETDRNHALIQDITDNIKGAVRLYPNAKCYAKTSQYKTKEYICIAPASLWFTKQYPEAQWVDLIQAVPADTAIYLLGGPADQALCNRIAKASQCSNVLSLAGQLSFLETTALMRDAVMNFVNDSAPQHMATAINAPVTAIFCSTVPEFGFGPLSAHSRIVQTNTPLDCKPCGLHGYKACPKNHFNCAKTIHTHQLLEGLWNS